MWNTLHEKTVVSIAALALVAVGLGGCSSATNAETTSASPSKTVSAPAETSPSPSQSATSTKSMTRYDYAKHDMKFLVLRSSESSPYGADPEFAKVTSEDGTIAFSAMDTQSAFKVGMNTYLKLRTDPKFSRTTRTPESDAQELQKYKTLSDFLLKDAKKSTDSGKHFDFVPYHIMLSASLWESEDKDVNDHDTYLIDTQQRQTIGFDGFEFVAGTDEVSGHELLEIIFTEEDQYKLAEEHTGSVTSVIRVVMAKIDGEWLVDGLHWKTWTINVQDKNGKKVLNMEDFPY
ncbi:hypothetical protein [Glutamicibacter sp. JC586]|uniref:hypothetical protein n=1 Tax=Glutamicibacter sp. JC586 TaxID=2590552 RepID=UPI001356F22B|nr:hypothetical protein [Glutamicibacter sp. JC586]